MSLPLLLLACLLNSPAESPTPLEISTAAELPRTQAAEPTPERVGAAVADLRAAYAQKDLDLLVGALAANRVSASKVVALLAKGLDHKSPKIRQAALEALRFTPHTLALRKLHNLCKRNSKLCEDEQLGPLLYKAIGQHGQVSSIPFLTDKLLSVVNPDIIRARIFALGHIRDRKAIDALIELQRAAKPGVVARYARALRMSLMQVTGVDRGESAERWRSWWSDHKAKFEVPEHPPLLPNDLQRAWDSFWGLKRVEQRGQRREDRGGD